MSPPPDASGQQVLRGRAALGTVRSALVGLLLVALFGSFAAVVSYRADVAEVHRQVRDRVAHQGRLYADSLALHFDVLRVELQRLADRGFGALAARDAEVQAGIREDRALFADGVALLDLTGHVVWSEPAGVTICSHPSEFLPTHFEGLRPWQNRSVSPCSR